MVQMKVRISLSQGFFPLLFSFLIILSLVGCAQENDMSTNGENRQLNFSVTTSGWNRPDSSFSPQASSRAMPISGTTFDTSKSFNMIADENRGGSWSTEINNETVSYSSTNKIWQTSSTHYWPGTGSIIDFYAYYPTSISGSITHTTGSVPVLSYAVPDNAADQIDILASSKTGVAGDSYNQTPVDFKHILAAVQFRVGSSGMINGTITRISLNGIQNTGSYSFAGGWAPQTSSTTTYTKNVSAASDAGTEIVSGNDPFLVMPQTLLNASFTVTYSGGATLTKSLSGTWEAGKVYDYSINSSFSATQDFSYTGDVQSYIVPFTGTYKLEVWGAEGGTGSNTNLAASLGGYSSGYKHLNKGDPLYITVGSKGLSYEGSIGGNGGYNGGGNGGNGGGSYNGGSGGGGATCICTTNRGTLNNYHLYTSEILIVAGGAGGREGRGQMPIDYGCIGSTGGGQSGGSESGSGGGTQITGYSFGLGENGYNGYYNAGSRAEGSGGGGGGFYGGYTTYMTGGGGGSGYIGNVDSGITTNGVRSGNGYARITFVSAN
jgi:hypothetical protein